MSEPRSYLFIPGDSERKLGKADVSGADALVLDLEDSVAPAAKVPARALVAAFLRERPLAKRAAQLWVRINPLDTALALDDLVAVVEAEPDGIMLPKANGPEDLARLSNYLDALEARAGLALGRTRVMPVATETAIAPLRLAEYHRAPLPRLSALTWGAEDLSTALGASTNRGADGDWAPTFQLARSLALLTARACNVQPVDTLFADFRDTAGLRESSARSRAEGFTGRLVIHPAQVEIVNEAYLPSQAEIERAARIVAAFAAAPGAGTVGLDGKMLDVPHLKQAQALLAAAARAGR